MAIPIPRNPGVDLTGVPKHWVAGNPVATAISNGINLLFPHGERFFVRSVHHYLDQITDPTLKAQVKAFFKQEGHHASAHDDFNVVLRAQGFEIDRFLDRYAKIARWLEDHMPPKLNLAGTAAAEHFTAILADGSFENGILDVLDPAMQKLLAWHAAEEIEHKAVAFDVLRQIDPSYWLRIAGLAHATILLSSFWAWSTVSLLRQEKLGWRGVRKSLAAMKVRPDDGPIVRRVFLRGIRQYIRRDFHPSDNANEHLARAWFEKHGMEFTEAA
jgi:predicted metal-dependent hydrolase